MGAEWSNLAALEGPAAGAGDRAGLASWAAALQTALSAWLLVSVLVLPHRPADLHSTWISGSLGVACGVFLLRAPWLQYLTAAVGSWLVFSAIGLSTGTLTAWHNGLIGAALLGLSFVPAPGDAAVLQRRRPLHCPAPPGHVDRAAGEHFTSEGTPTELLDSPSR